MARNSPKALRRYPGFSWMAAGCLLLLYAPMIVITIYSFNSIRSITTWGGFSVAWYLKAVSNPNIQSATPAELNKGSLRRRDLSPAFSPSKAGSSPVVSG
mgnify:CR=1 FL=1